MLILSFSLLPGHLYAKYYHYPGSKVTPKAGDILVTSSTVSSGIIGHAAIVVNSTEIMEIRGPGYHPKVRSISSWFKSFKNTKVIRINNYTKAKHAAAWAKKYNRKAKYKITSNLQSTNPTYCSKIVYQAYTKGTSGVFPKYGKGYYWPPYNFLFKRSYHPGLHPKVVYKKGHIYKGDL
ncbi:CHAP domain-containing protein [Scopulibacillus daqui]|uniref:CHAP domain-containing protein n=1 Tax=Scopulibacillus daqui TaxID=1469162 RepID=UPI001960E05C